jgi:uroporphyrin-III C-methyltransferase/precorrin-2 dehydrogenase/sirohydrochlorin ferrochelatase
MLNLASNGGLAGSVRLIPMRWSADAFAGAAVIVADAATRAEALEICTAAGTAGIPLNVIDQPEFCGFQFGAIVNRSPLVIGISTSGSVPVLAQEIRSRIESILPPNLARWVHTAGRLRRIVSRRMATARERRRFWESFVARAMSSKPQGGAPERVTVITAPTREDLTLREIRALQVADVIHVGDCCPAGILDFARREARRIKLAGCEANSEGVGNVVIIRG